MNNLLKEFFEQEFFTEFESGVKVNSYDLINKGLSEKMRWYFEDDIDCLEIEYDPNLDQWFSRVGADFLKETIDIDIDHNIQTDWILFKRKKKLASINYN